MDGWMDGEIILCLTNIDEHLLHSNCPDCGMLAIIFLHNFPQMSIEISPGNGSRPVESIEEIRLVIKVNANRNYY
tara:strand:- start:63 stop:287 length:225 start_codon:yes stop_codon:yes gene_type:complete